MRPPDESPWRQGHPSEGRRALAEVLVPLLPSEALRGPILIVAAHPEDEILGASWLLQHGPGCHVVHVTDGAPKDASLRAPDAPPTREAYARQREEEALAALSLVGMNSGHLLSLGAVDLEAACELVPLTHCLVALMKALRPSLLVVHPYEGGHPDHDAAAFAAHAAVALLGRAGRTPPALLEMASHHRHQEALGPGGFLPAPEERPVATVALTEAERALKRRMLACHASRARVLEAFPVEWERYRAAPRYDFIQPPHQGPLPYESFGGRMTGALWRELARRSLEELKLPEAPWH